MLQKSHSEFQSPFVGPEADIDLLKYVQILKRRAWYGLIVFALLVGGGLIFTMMLKPVYFAAGRILVESQSIPADLVRPTITGSAKERIQILEQRVMTRDNLLAIVDKFELFGERRQRMSTTMIVDSMRRSIQIQPVELDPSRQQATGPTIALTIGFEHERPELALKVANELIGLILEQDVRNRRSRATEAVQFLAREARRLEDELAALDSKIAEARRQPNDPGSERVLAQLASLRAELNEKSSLYAATHPEIRKLKQQIAGLERMTTRAPAADTGLEALQGQRAATQKNLDGAAQKLAAARLGESLERDQSERMEVLERPALPQLPVRPNRLKIFAVIVGLAAMAGLAVMFAVEILDKAIHSSLDLVNATNGMLVVSIPYISTPWEARRKKIRIVSAAVIVVAGLVATHLLVQPLDELTKNIWGRFG